MEIGDHEEEDRRMALRNKSEGELEKDDEDDDADEDDDDGIAYDISHHQNHHPYQWKALS